MQAKCFRQGLFVWHAYHSINPAEAVGFYREVFGWDIVPAPKGSEWATHFLMLNGVSQGSLVHDPAAEKSYWQPYINVHSLEEMLQKAVGLGGKAVRGERSLAGLGKTALVEDTTGSVTGLVEQAGEGHLMPDYGGLKAFTWDQLRTEEFAKAANYYGDLLGWKIQPDPQAPGGPLSLAKNEGKEIASMLGYPPGMTPPPRWVPFVGVEDVEEAIGRVIARGGQVLSHLLELPEICHHAIVEDPWGAAVGPFCWLMTG